MSRSQAKPGDSDGIRATIHEIERAMLKGSLVIRDPADGLCFCFWSPVDMEQERNRLLCLLQAA